MTGLNFQTQTIINQNVDLDSKVKDSKLFEAVDNTLKVKRDFTFEKKYVKAIRKAEGANPEACKVEINFGNLNVNPTSTEKVYCRLDVYLGVEGAEPAIYSNAMAHKGVPFWVEFVVTSTNKSNLASIVENMIKKNHLFMIDKDLIDTSVSGNVLTLTGASEYQRFKNVEICTFAADSDYAEKVAELGSTAITLKNSGKNGFGTYSQITKDLRLPTAANGQWSHVRQSETPVVGAVYNQYIIEYCAPASNGGMQYVGQHGNSHTTHVFWVKRESAETAGALVTAWETALNSIDPDGGTLTPENVAPTVEERLSELEKA